MNEKFICDYENGVVKVLNSGFITEEIKTHLASCANCREAAKIVKFFRHNLIKESKSKPLPAAGLIWWKSQLREKQRNAVRISQPMAIVQAVSIAIFIGLFIWLVNTETFQLSQFGAAVNRVFAALEEVLVFLATGIICFLIIGATLIFTLRRLLLEK